MSNLFKSKKQTTETQKTEIDPQIYQQVLANLDLARQVASIPYQPYTGLMVAPFTRDYMAGEDVVRRIAQEGGFVPELEMAARQAAGDLGFQAGQITAPTYDPRVMAERIGAERVGASLAGGPMQIGAQQVGRSLSGGPMMVGARDIGASLAGGPMMIGAGQVQTQFQAPTIGAERVGASLAGGPQQVRAGQLGTTFAARDINAPGAAPLAQGASVLGRDIQQYMSPYTQNVIEAGLSDIDRAAALRQQDIGAQATRARAFGGSRQAVQEGIAAGEAERERNRFIAEQRAQAFSQAMQAREADTSREQQAGIANQAAVQNVMEMAQRGEISNQQRDIELQRLGVTAGTQNIEAGLRADLANQQAVENYMRLGLTAEQANQQAMLDAQRSNQAAVQEAQRLSLAGQTTNVQTGLEASRANQAAVENYMRMGLTAEQANQQASLDAQRSNQSAVENYMRLGLTAEQANQQANLEAARSNQSTVQDYMRMGLTAEQANQQAMLDAARSNQSAGLQARQAELGAMGDQASRILQAQQANEAARLGAANFRLGAGQQLAGFGQTALQNRYGSGQQLMALGTGQQALAQQYLDAQQQEFMRRQNYPLQQLAILQGAVAASPYNQTVTGSTTQTSRPSYFNILGQTASFAAPFFSDESMKKNIKTIKNPLDKVNRLRGVDFEWAEMEDDNDDELEGKDRSVIAQDVQKVMPEAVMEDDGKLKVGAPQMIGLLTEAVKELDAKVESMGGRKRGKKVRNA
jgi:hypothetical protein